MKKRENKQLALGGLTSQSTEKDMDLNNAAFFNNGRVTPRESYRSYMAGLGAGSAFRAVYVFRNRTFVLITDGAKSFLRMMVNGVAQVIPGIEEGLSRSTYADFVEANGLLFIAPSFDSASFVYVIEYTAGSTTPFVGRKSFATTIEDDLLRCGVIAEHKGTMFAARIRDLDTDGELSVNKLRWSKYAEPENFDAWGDGLSYTEIGEPNDPIIRLVSFKNDLIVFKQSSVWLVTGFVAGGNGEMVPEIVREINHELGLVGPHALDKDEEKIVFISHMGFFVFDGTNFTKVDEAVWEHIRDLPRNTWYQACVCLEDDMERIHFLMPGYGQSIEVDYVMCEDKRWSRWTFPYQVSFMKNMSDDNKRYYNFVGTSQNLLLARGESDEVVNVTYTTDWTDLGFPGSKQPRSLELLLTADGDFPVAVTVQTDFGFEATFTTTTNQNQLNYKILDNNAVLDAETITPDRNLFFPWVIDLLVGTCRRLKFKFSGPMLTIIEAKVGFIRGTRI